MTARYVDANALCEEIHRIESEMDFYTGAECLVTLMKMLTADVVEVVRCKDCKHKQELSKWEKVVYVEGCIACTQVSPGSDRTVMCANDFCSYGERVTDTNVGGK